MEIPAPWRLRARLPTAGASRFIRAPFDPTALGEIIPMKTTPGRIVAGLLVLALVGGCSTAPAPATSTKPTATIGKPSPAPGDVLVIDEVDVPPKVLHRVEPEYPPELIQYKASGDIVLRLLVLADGSVVQVRTKHTKYLEFMRPAHDALNQWRFEPAIKDGKPTACRVEILFTLSPP